jgi:hypothetical protein
MGRVAIKKENRVETYESFPRLKLDLNEEVRIAFLEDPEVAWVHTLRRPKIVNGKPEMVWKETRKGEQYETNAMDFVSNPQCLGLEGILEERGVDPQNCPACAMSKKGDLTTPPQRRYAAHVFKYNTKQNSMELASPYSGQVVVWSFTDKMFNKLIDLTDEDVAGPLDEHDIKITCKSKEFQQFELTPLNKAAWAMTASTREQTETAMTENKAKDLSLMCGRKMTREAIQDDLDAIEEAWRIVNGTADEVAAADRQNLNDSLQGILKSSKPAETSEEDTGESESTPVESTGGFAELMAMAERKK